MPKPTSRYNLYGLKPGLAIEWHTQKNVGLTPQEVTPGSGKKVWWICKEGHEWEAVIYSRTRGSGCPFCSKQKNSSFINLASEDSLIKEWHSNKNGTLNPQNIEPGYRKKVWWICENGHEWQATISRRMRDGGCPICIEIDYEVDRQLFGMTEIYLNRLPPDDVDTQANVETYELNIDDDAMDFRKNKRFRYTITGLLEDSKTGYFVYAEMKNYCQDGMYFETETAFIPETTIDIKFDKPLERFSRKKFSATVRWCKELFGERGSMYRFGLGVEFI
jgi:hypothetical protein